MFLPPNPLSSCLSSVSLNSSSLSEISLKGYCVFTIYYIDAIQNKRIKQYINPTTFKMKYKEYNRKAGYRRYVYGNYKNDWNLHTNQIKI